MQKKIKIKTKDKHSIFGTLDYSKNHSDSLIIFVHGFTGSQNEHHYFNAVPFFTRHGFTTFRFNFYDKNPESRQLQNSSISTHVSDLGTVCTYFEKKYKKIILIGHSLGTLVILLSNLSAIAKIILWDPTTGFKDVREKNGYFNKKLNAYIFNWGKAIIVSKQMVEEWQKLKTKDLVKKITIPCKFIFAGNEDKYKSWKPFLRRTKLADKISVIKGASHTFTEENVENKLFVETLKSIQ